MGAKVEGALFFGGVWDPPEDPLGTLLGGVPGLILKVFTSCHALPCFVSSGLIFSCLVNAFSDLSRPVVSCLVFSGHMSDMRFTS